MPVTEKLHDICFRVDIDLVVINLCGFKVVRPIKKGEVHRLFVKCYAAEDKGKMIEAANLVFINGDQALCVCCSTFQFV